jgi:hypothetical protein
MRRGNTAVAEHEPVLDTRDVDLARAAQDLAAALDELDIANGRADRERAAKEKAQAALRDTAADVAAMHDAVLPSLAAIHPAPFDEPMPDDARVTKAGKCIGTWPPVPGDRIADWPAVEVVDFGPLYALIGADLVAA